MKIREALAFLVDSVEGMQYVSQGWKPEMEKAEKEILDAFEEMVPKALEPAGAHEDGHNACRQQILARIQAERELKK